MEKEKSYASHLEGFKDSLHRNEKSQATIKKYTREIGQLIDYLNGRKITKDLLIDYREYLQNLNLVQTVNGKLSAINAFLEYMGLQCCKLKLFRVQRAAFVDEKRELTEQEYKRLLDAAKKQDDDRLYHLMLTIAGTGIRISELKFITIDALEKGQAKIYLKGKGRTILLQKSLRTRLMKYVKGQGIREGYVFQTKSGKPLDRSNICHDMKKLCKLAEVEPGKVFPHNCRHLFARTFYAIEKNLAHLADILGHSSIETTRIYVAASAKAYEETLDKMCLLL